jgi:hypothetical protein
MSNQNAEVVSVRIIPNTEGKPPGKLADAEVIFEAEAGPLSGMKLVGFAIWERRSGSGRNVTFPARQYSVNGDRRSFALLRPKNGDVSAQEAVRDLILEAFSASEARPTDLMDPPGADSSTSCGDVAADGKRFLTNTTNASAASPPPLTMVEN